MNNVLLRSRLALYLITDSRFMEINGYKRSLIDVVKAAIEGGTTAVQYREKQASTKQMVSEVMKLKKLCNSHGVLFFVNDRIDVALAVDADGVHLGQNDMPLTIARRIFGGDKIIGITVHNEEELVRAELEGADYVSFAPVFATPTKPDHKTPMGTVKLSQLASKTRLPSVAIGGINLDNAEEVYKTGIDGVCIISSIMQAADPEYVARAFIERYHRAKSNN